MPSIVNHLDITGVRPSHRDVARSSIIAALCHQISKVTNHMYVHSLDIYN